MIKKRNDSEINSDSDDGNRISNEELKEGIRKERMNRLASASELQLKKDIEGGKTESKLNITSDFKVVLNKEDKEISEVQSEDILSGSLNVKKPENSIFKDTSFFPEEEQKNEKESKRGLLEFSNKNLIEGNKKESATSTFFNDAFKNKPSDIFNNAPKADSNAFKADSNAFKADSNAFKADSNANIFNNAPKADSNAFKTDSNANIFNNAPKADSNANIFNNAPKADSNANIFNNAPKADSNAPKADSNANIFNNAPKADSNANVFNNAPKADSNANIFNNAPDLNTSTAETNFFKSNLNKNEISLNATQNTNELKTNVKFYEEPNHKLKIALKKYFQLYGKKIKVYDGDISKYQLDEEYIYSFINNDDQITTADDLNILIKNYSWDDNNINYFISLYCCANNIINKNILTVENIKEIYFNTFDVKHITNIYDFIKNKDRSDFLYELYTKVSRKHNLNNLVYNGLHNLINEHLISSNITLKREDEEFIEKYFSINNLYEKQIFDINLLVELIYCNIGDELRRGIFTQLTFHTTISNILLDKLASYNNFKFAYEMLVIFKNNQYEYRRIIPGDFLNEKILKLLIEEYNIIEKNEYIDHVLLYIKELYSSIVDHSSNIKFNMYNRALFVAMIRTVHCEFFTFLNLFNLKDIINILIVNYKHMYNQFYFNINGLQWILSAVKVEHKNSIYYRTMAVYNMGNKVAPVLSNYIDSILIPFIYKTYESFGELMLYYYKETGDKNIFNIYEYIGAVVTVIKEEGGSKKKKYSYFPIPELNTDIFYNLMAVRLILLGYPKLDCTHILYNKVLKIINRSIDVNFASEYFIKDFKEGSLLRRYTLLTQNSKNFSLLKKEYERICYCSRNPTEGEIKYATGLLIAMMKIRGKVKICGCGRQDVVEIAEQVLN